jgi:nucleoside-diphosphate kinase
VERSLIIVKPDAVRRNLIGSILSFFEDAGLRVAALRMMRLSEERAGAFYQVHEGKTFYEKLKAYMSSGDIVAGVVEGDNAIERVRGICGATDPAAATAGTIRATFGVNVTMNSVHASDSPASAVVEIAFFFPHFG